MNSDGSISFELGMDILQVGVPMVCSVAIATSKGGNWLQMQVKLPLIFSSIILKSENATNIFVKSMLGLRLKLPIFCIC